MTYKDDTRVWPILTQLSSCLCREITAQDLPEPCFCGVLSGDSVSLDYCGECGTRCGMAWVRLVGISATQISTPTGVIIPRTARTCHIASEIIFEVGIVRCAPMPDDDGTMPSMAKQLEAARLQTADMNAALRAITCGCLEADFSVDTWAPISGGDCLGGAWSVIVEVD